MAEQKSRLVLEIDSRDAEQKAVDVQKALDALESAGLRIKPAMDKASTGLDGLNKSGSDAGKSADGAGKAWSAATDGIGKGIQQVVKELQSLNAKQDAAAKLIESLGLSLSKASTSFLDVASSAGKLKPSNDAAAASIEKVGETAEESSARLLAMAKRSLETSDYVKSLSASTTQAGNSFDYAADKAERLSDLARRMRAESDANVKTNNTLAGGTKKAAVATEEQAKALRDLLAKIDPVNRKLNELDDMESKLAKNKKFLEPEVFAQYQAKIVGARNELNGLNGDLKDFGLTTKGAQRDAAQLLNALKSGDWQGAARNFQQISVSAGGTGNALRSLTGLAKSFVNPATVGAAAVSVLGLAFYDAEKEASQFNKALFSGTANTGLTGLSLSSLTKDAAALTGSFSKAKEAVIALSSAGRLSEAQFANLSKAAAAISEFTGKGAGEVAKTLGEMSGNASEAARKISSEYGLITSAQYQVIAALDEQGKKQEALDLLSEMLNKNAEARLDKYRQSLSVIERGWGDIGTAIVNSYRNIRDEIFPDLNKQIEIIERILNTRKDGGVTGALSSAFGFGGNSTEALEAELKQLKERRDVAAAIAKTAGDAGRADQARIEALGKWDALHKSNLFDQAKLENDIKEARKLGLEAGKSQVEIEKEVAIIQAKYDKSKAKPKAYHEDAGLKMLDAARQTQAVLIQQNASINAQGIATERVGAQAQALIKWEQQLADIKGKKTLTADQKSLLASQDLITAQLKKNAVLEKEAQLSKDTLQAQKDQVQLLTLTGQLQKANQLKSSLDDAAQLAEYERQGNVEAAKRLETLIKIRDVNLKAAQKPGTIEGVTKAPAVTGLDASVGGAYSEIQRLTDESTKLDAWREMELEKQKSYLDLKAINEETYAARIANINQQAQDNQTKIEQAKNNAVLSYSQDFFGNMAALSASGNSKLAAIGKAAAIAQATIQGYVAVQNALAVQPYPLGVALAISAGIAAAANVAAISGVGFSGGGYTGAGGVNEYAGDVHKGEVVWSQADIRRHGGVATVEALRKGNVSPIRPGATGSGSGSGSGGQDSGVGKPGGNVNIHNYGGNQVEAQRDGDDWNIFIKRAKREIAGDLASGNGDITRALTNGYGLRRVPR
ncbi:phage tail length tape measure family protein [Pseudomonas helleri]|uniref:phage tail length tape measure family protein n=1 Tax=Pseudomonas helleri TaxID=1608996 RepID=UPI003FD148D6